MKTEELIKNLPLSSGCEVIKFDECGLIAINKKAGRATHPNASPSKNAKPPMLRARYNMRGEYYSWENAAGDNFKLYLANRLDSPTSGVVIAAANPEAAAAAKLAFKNKTVQKTYLAICKGRVGIEDKWVDNLAMYSKGKYVRTEASRSGKTAITYCKFVREDLNKAKLCLAELRPITGFTHQLRVQCARRGFPILGDATYGDFAFNKKFRSASKINRLFLHCAKTELKISLGGSDIEFSAEAPLPKSFSSVLDFNIEISKVFWL